MSKVLEGTRVLDLSHYKAGPTCGQFLADMGAEVIRIEKPGGEEDRRLGPFAANGQSIYLAFTCRNKKGITLNLQKDKGKDMLKKLVRQSDVVIENFGPVGNKKLGLDYESLKKIKSDIIVVAVSGYGQYGPYANRLGFDGIAQAIAGMMWVTGFPDKGEPVKAGVGFVDFATGVYGALGTLLALHHREKTGKGQLVDVSLLDSAVSFMEYIFGEYEVANYVHPQLGNAHPFIGPYDAYKAKDGYFFLGVISNPMWRRLLKFMGREELADDPRFKTDLERGRLESHRFFAEWINNWASEKTVKEVVEQLNEADIPCAPVNTIPEAASDPHIRAREMITELDHPGIGNIPLIGIPIKLSETPGEIKTPAPTVGQHNEELYSSLLGLDSEQLSQLEREGVI